MDATIGEQAGVLADAILMEDVPAENAYSIVNLVVEDTAQLDDQDGFEGLCESQLDTDDCEESRLPLLRYAQQLWSDPVVRAAAVEIVRTRCQEELALPYVD